MVTLAYIAASDADLAVQWLERISAQGHHPVLVADAEALPLLRALALRFGLEHYALPPTPDCPEAVALRPLLPRVNAAEAAVLLCDPVPFTLMFRAQSSVPSWNDRFPAIRVLHRLGVRHFRFLGRAGEWAVEIPWLLDDFVGRHQGQPAYVIGNGPSLRAVPMARLKNAITFGSNRSFLGYPEWGYAFTYWGISDRLQIEMYREEYEAGIDRAAIKFFPFEYLSTLRLPNACPVPMISDLVFGEEAPLPFPYFSEDPSCVFMAYTVTIALIQIAAMMGCSPIILLGVDHNYPITQVRRQGADGVLPRNPTSITPPDELHKMQRLGWDFWEGSATSGATHFTERYTHNKLFVPPRTAQAEVGYEYCRLWGERAGVEIVNATPGSKLNSFPHVALEQFLP